MATMTSGITVSAPVVSAATYVNPNAGAYASYTAGEYAAGKPVATFSSNLFNQTWQPVTNARGQSQYDISRTTAETASQRAQQIRSAALQRQLSGQGLTDSGIALKQGQLLNADVQSSLQSGIAGVNQAELAAAETNRQAALSRQYGAETLGVQNAQQTGERLGTQAFQGMQTTEQIAANKELTYADLSFREQQLSQQASQFTSSQDFQRWAVQAGYSNDEVVRAWTANENSKNRAATKEVAGMQITSTEKIANANIASNEKISAAKDYLTQQGIDISHAQVYGFTDAQGNHVAGSIEIAAGELGLKTQTLAEQQKELWGWTDQNGQYHQGKYDLLSAEQKRAADALYGANINGKHVRGSLENDSMLTDLKARETQVGVDSFYGYTDPTTGQVVKGSGQIAAETFGLKSKELADQEAELYGYVNPSTHEFVPGKIQLLSNEDQRAVSQLYGYSDPLTGQHVMGTLELDNARKEIEQQGLDLKTAELKGWDQQVKDPRTGAVTTVHHMGTEELEQKKIQAQKDIVTLEYQLKSGLMDKQQVIDTDKLVQQERAQRYYDLGKSGAADPAELNYLLHTDPLAYEAFMSGKSGKAFDDVQKQVDLTNKYRATQIENLDDPATQETITKMFASWGVEEAAQDQKTGANAPTPGSFGAKDFSTYDMGKSVLLDRPTISATGVTIPPGTYTVSRVNETRKGEWDAGLQDWKKETGEATYLTDASGNKIQAQFNVTSTEKGADWWNNQMNPLSASFWEHPFGIHW